MKRQVLILVIAIATTMTSFTQDMAVTFGDDLGQVEMEALDITREWAINYTPSIDPDQISWASFPGGKEAMFEFLGSKGQVDMDAVNSGEQCLVYVKFTVNIDGSISDIQVTSNDWKALNTSAMDTIKEMPSWNPTKKGDSVVKTEVILPRIRSTTRLEINFEFGVRGEPHSPQPFDWDQDLQRKVLISFFIGPPITERSMIHRLHQNP